MSEPLAASAQSLPASRAGLAPVVVVEDDRTSQLAVELHLHLLSLANPLIAAETGTAARDVLQALVDDGSPPALVLLDGHLGEVSGLEVLRWMRSVDALVSTPVIMLTGESAVEWISEAYRYGVASYLVKPVGFDALEQALRALDSPWALLAP